MDPSASSHLNFHDFLARMRHPSSSGLVRSIKRFIVSLTFHTTTAELDGKNLQGFLMMMENTIKEHPLWVNASDEEIDNAIEGLEKYIMTKLFNRTFASSPKDASLDREVSNKIRLLQQFIKPDHLDVPEFLKNEASLLFAAKELQKINSFKSPREKLLCVMNCCRVINNLLLNVSMSMDHIPSGADEFLPVLIYVTIKANPPQLHSNIRFIQLYRRESKLVSEVEYYLTNLISAKSFIVDLGATSLSMEESEFHKNMENAKFATGGTTVTDPECLSASSEDIFPTVRRQGKEIQMEVDEYPFMEAEAKDLTLEDTHVLLSLYKKVVTKHRLLSKALSQLSLDEDQLLNSVKTECSSLKKLENSKQ